MHKRKFTRIAAPAAQPASDAGRVGRTLQLLLLLAFLAVSVSANAAEVTLAWDPNTETDLGGYTLYSGTSSRSYANSVDIGLSTEHTVPNLVEGDTYYFAVTAYDTNGNESPFSAEISYSVPVATTPQQFTISASAGSNGSISPSGGITVAGGNDQSFTITASAGYQIADVLVDGNSVGAVSAYTFSNVSSDHSIQASFAPIATAAFTISASAGSNGSVSPSGSIAVDAGDSQQFAITPASGYRIADVLVDGASVGAVTAYTFSDVQSDHTLQAAFEAAAANQPPAPPTGAYPQPDAQGVSATPLLEIDGFQDPDSQDIHGATQWQIATDSGFGSIVFDAVSSAEDPYGYLVDIQVPPGVLFPDRYYFWRARVKDGRPSESMWSAWSQPSGFATASPPYTDHNANGIPDAIEPQFCDFDGDGQNDNDQALMRVFAAHDGTPVGIKAAAGVSRVIHYNAVQPEDIQAGPCPVALDYELLNFNLQVNRTGGTAVVEIHLPGEASPQARAYKYDPVQGWYDFPLQVIDGVYVIEITDGGQGDADGVANGIVVDPLGLSISGSDSSDLQTDDGSGGGGGGCFIGAAESRCTATLFERLRSYLLTLITD